MAEKIVVISGPTAAGKSALALQMAQAQDSAIINADSLQIYAGLPLLSSQPSEAEKKSVPHFLYSYLQPDQNSSVVLWLEALKPIIKRCFDEKKLPIIVGGSGMYISKLIEGISEVPQIDDKIRQQSRQLFDEIGPEKFQEKLMELGEEKILDKQRMTRAYEVLMQSGKSISWWQKQSLKKCFPAADFLHINLNPNREQLYQNCNLRFVKMLNLGAIEEVQSLLKQGVNDNYQISKTLGFLEISDFLSGKISQDKMIEIATQKTRNYAKRQLTWFRNQLPQKLVFGDIESALNFLQK